MRRSLILSRLGPLGWAIPGFLLTFLASHAQEPVRAAYLQRPAIVFSIDQGFRDSPIPIGDLAGLQRYADVLKSFGPKYEAYALFNGALADKAKLRAALDLLARNGVPFIMDVYDSDTLTNTRQGPDAVDAPFDVQHGRGVSVAELADYKHRYGQLFAGLRVFEVFSLNYSILSCQKLGRDWDRHWKENVPTQDTFYQRRFLDDYAKFAHANGMFLLFGDWFWSAHHHSAFIDDVVHEPANEQDLKDICRIYPGTVVVMYDNNEPNGASLPRLSDWDKIVKPFVDAGAKGFGLSDQSWLSTGISKSDQYELKTPVADLVRWGQSDFDRGGVVLQLEPFWYWFRFPKPRWSEGAVVYTQDPAWADAGSASANLAALASALGVNLPDAGLHPKADSP